MFLFSFLQEDENLFGEVREDQGDDSEEGEEASDASKLQTNVS